MVEVIQKNNKNKKQSLYSKLKNRNNTQVFVGFFENARYPDGTRVAQVATYNEFGTATIPERPFNRIANEKTKKQLLKANKTQNFLKYNTDVISNIVGELARSNVVEAIIDLKDPPNTKATIRDKKGKSNPLVSTDLLSKSVFFKVKDDN